jgi:diguanylate cyclase
MFNKLITKSLKILLISQSKIDAKFIEKALSQPASVSCAVVSEVTLNASLRTISELEFDVAMLDMSVPDSNGIDAMRAINNIAPKLPIILLAEHGDEELAMSAIEYGAQDYLLKEQMDIQNIRRSIQFAIQRKRFELMLILQANSDSLTGLANRTIFEMRVDAAIERSKRSGEMLGILFMDLNRFKFVNDNFGHNYGDKLLQEVSNRMKNSVRPYDGLSRFGGDEFALLVDDIKHLDNCAKIAHKIITQLAKPFFISGHKFEIGVSIGIAVCNGEDNLSRAELIKYADDAMYAAKKTGKSEYKFYEFTSNQEKVLANMA